MHTNEITAEKAVARSQQCLVQAQAPGTLFPEHLPRERAVVPGPTPCQCFGGNRLRKLGETITEMLESIPLPWKVARPLSTKVHHKFRGSSSRRGCGAQHWGRPQ